MNIIRVGIRLDHYGLSVESLNLCFEKIADNCPVGLLARIQIIPLYNSDITNMLRLPPRIRLYSDYGDRADSKSVYDDLDVIITDNVELAIRLAGDGLKVCFVVSRASARSDVITCDNLFVFHNDGQKCLSSVFKRVFLWIYLFESLNYNSKCNHYDAAMLSCMAANGINSKSVDDIERLLTGYNVPFEHVVIETTSVCNLKCKYCPNSKFERAQAFMPAAMYYKIIDSVHDCRPGYNGTISLNFYGEPLLDQRLEDFVRYARHFFPSSHIQINTNGIFLNLDRYWSLLEAGVSWFCITRHTKEPCPVTINTMSAVSREYPDQIRFNYIDGLVNISNRGGLIDLPVASMPDSAYLNCNAYRDLVINVHGDVVLCCNDYHGEHMFGNVANKSVADIWSDVANCYIRNQLLFGYLPLEICRRCVPLHT